ncbi:hypothetical protein CES85_5867 (plasmid) [Ochrobactrum quorumnocens]|uniref:Uncharacterized protein n=1 Tax=Ochrobactrum quorumnocens TaxID=271865 RepID=A0A248U940_9HYPH|nr:hypothetical protein CES85_5867 [[Ochrobactrum] quorumnocens]
MLYNFTDTFSPCKKRFQSSEFHDLEASPAFDMSAAWTPPQPQCFLKAE